MPRTTGPIFTRSPGSAPAPTQHVNPTKLSQEVVRRIDERERQKNLEKKRKREHLKKQAKRTTLDLIAAKIVQLALKRFVFTPLAFQYFGTLTKMYMKAGGLTKLAASAPYYKLAKLVVDRLISVATKLVLSHLKMLYKKALEDKTLTGKKRFKLTALNLKLRLAAKTGNFDSFVSFLHDSFMWPLVKTSKELEAGVRLLKKLSDLRNPKSVKDIRDIIKTTALLAKWSKMHLNNAKLQKRVQTYSVKLNKGLTAQVKSYDDFKI